MRLVQIVLICVAAIMIPWVGRAACTTPATAHGAAPVILVDSLCSQVSFGNGTTTDGFNPDGMGGYYIQILPLHLVAQPARRMPWFTVPLLFSLFAMSAIFLALAVRRRFLAKRAAPPAPPAPPLRRRQEYPTAAQNYAVARRIRA